ncbi:protein NLP5 [Selaginella moellendorffii]|uniref:protein NLP5 n=1 Tax=Selaginella moellendorffii TaxID=88036 RepID=UPI000D1C742B|nr:protein NLP5 [Selaginella moellendorffii]|eukprot:XP_024522521.1 protein NLP5 [Selaginella moellendorffii]
MSERDDGFFQMVCELLPGEGGGGGGGGDCFMDDPGFPNSIPPAADWATNFLTSPPFQSGSFSSLLEDLLLSEPPPEDTAASSPDQWEGVAAEEGEDEKSKARGRKPHKSELLGNVLRRISCERTEFLAQVWVPTMRNSRVMLTTQDQPYAVQPTKWDLVRYRTLSARYAFPVAGGIIGEVGGDVLPGLPGRVYSRMLPEWSPNVQFYDCKDFLRVQDAARCNVRGTLAVPVIEPSTRECLAVIELVANVEKVGYESEMGMICKALEDINLSSWPRCGVPEVPKAGREAVFEEISGVLLAVCEYHQLPLAQTWIPCFQSSGKSSGNKNLPCLLASHAPFHVRDSSLEGFHRACSQQKLEAGQGVAGKASTTNQPSFTRDVKSYSIAEYPLVNYARYFKLGAAVAIRLRSRLTGSDDYVLEFVLPLECTEEVEQCKLLDALSVTMQQACQSLRMVSSREVLEQRSVVSSPRIVELHSGDEEMSGVVFDNSGLSATTTATTTTTKATAKRKKLCGDDQSSYWSACSIQGDGSGAAKKKAGEKKRATNEKTVPLDVLQQHFAGSLRDAARNIGVCPTTLKRICRQYGISRWPSRKINKVNRSLMKLQGVINSVEGADRKVKLDILTGEIASAAAATAAITSKKSNSGPSTSKSSSEASLKAETPAGKEGLNVFPDGGGTATSPNETPEIHTTEPRVNMLPAIKIEPRVHGSHAALSVLDQQKLSPERLIARKQSSSPPLPPPPPPPPGTQEHQSFYHQNQASYIDWPALSNRVLCSKEGTNCFEERAITVKATLREDTIRFKMGTEFGFGTLKGEVAWRFKLDKEGFTLKYMDDDAEWVVLNGDADLEECLDVMRFSGSRVIKLVVQPVSNPNAGSPISPSFCSVNS